MPKRKRTNWNPTDNRFIAFLDILGFKDLVARNSHEEIYKQLSEVSKTKDVIERIINQDDEFLDAGDAGIYAVRFSDSISLFSKNDNLDNFYIFIAAVNYLFADSILKNTPMKGAIAHGKVSINKGKQIYFGQPIIDAYMLEEEVQYLGIVAHNSIDAYIHSNYGDLDHETLEKEIFTANTPLRCGNVIHTNLNWFGTLRTIEGYKDNTKEKLENVIKQYRNSVSGAPRRYIDNTLNLLDGVSL